MPYRKIKFQQGSYYHIYNRGAGRQSIFYNHRDYLTLIPLMRDIAIECAVTIIAYCLLPNHYHWLVRQDGEIKAGKLPTRVFGSYSQTFNLRHSRSGTLFEGPYEAIPVGTDEYLHQLCRYIHANPVLHGIADSVDLWTYSNYHEWMGTRPGKIVDHGFIEEHFGTRDAYQAYLQSYLTGQAIMSDGLREYLDRLEG